MSEEHKLRKSAERKIKSLQEKLDLFFVYYYKGLNRIQRETVQYSWAGEPVIYKGIVESVPEVRGKTGGRACGETLA